MHVWVLNHMEEGMDTYEFHKVFATLTLLEEYIDDAHAEAEREGKEIYFYYECTKVEGMENV